MPRGIVKWFSDKKGFGFIKGEVEDIFVHYSDVRSEGFRTLKEGETVEFEVETQQKGSRAKDVVRV